MSQISSEWEQYEHDGTWTCMHFTDSYELSDKEDRDMMIRHCFLEVLDLLEVIRYERGYEGHYYEILI